MKERPQAVVLFADGFEEVEAVTPVDFLRRAGIVTHMVGIQDRDVVGSHGIRITTDYTLDELDTTPEVIIVPGGPGVVNLASDPAVCSLLEQQFSSGRYIAAICAAPAKVLGPLGLLVNRRYTCYPGLEENLKEGEFSTDRVVVDGNLISSRAAGSSAEFSREIIRILAGDEAADGVHSSTLQP
ncbi:DJ-1 family glyoxalase III [Spirochaeta dissipatitropha]